MRQQRNFTDGFNYYVPAQQAAGDQGQLKKNRIEFGVLVPVDVDGVLAAQSIASAGTAKTFAGTYNVDVMGKYGRNVTVVASGAATSAVSVVGRDYLGQPMREDFTLAGTTAQVGKKAFKYVDRVIYGNTASTTINVGWGTQFGLPYKTRVVHREYVNQVPGAAGTLVQPDITDPATATTGDPRGTYTFSGTINTTNSFSLDIEIDDFVNAANNGGTHGIRHFAG